MDRPEGAWASDPSPGIPRSGRPGSGIPGLGGIWGPTATATTEQTNEEESEEQQAAEDDAVLAEQVRHDVIQP